MSGPTDLTTRVAHDVGRLCANIGYVIQGKPDVIHNAVLCLLAEGHLLLEDVPGTGKTSLARALATSLSVSWNRIQFTPDLLPSDVTGVTVYNQSSHEFDFKPGPVFASVVLADEINRASPKTQSALLEVMEEGTVSTDGIVHPMPRPLMVVATQNPIDMEGTYVLPEAQLDRFLMKLTVGYPSAEAEAEILRTQKMGPTVEHLSPVLSAGDIAGMVAAVKQVEVVPALEAYIVAVAAATRGMSELRLGVSPRGSLALLRAARAAAAAAGRGFVIPEDVKQMAPVVLAHRVILQPEAELQGRTGAELIARALQSVPVPRGASA
jgi:MoxR-like ATPase